MVLSLYFVYPHYSTFVTRKENMMLITCILHYRYWWK